MKERAIVCKEKPPLYANLGLTFPFDLSVAHLELGGGVGCTPGLVQNRVVEAGVPQLHAFLIAVWAIAVDICSSWKTDISL